MTDKQLRFIDEYLVDCNGTQAAIRAGYSKKTANEQASRLLADVNISARIKERQAELSEKTKLTQEWVLLKLEECVKKSMQEEEIQRWDYESKSMVGTGEYIYDSKGATKALELIGKHIGMFKDKLELSGEVVVFKGDDALED